jgi:ATP-binding cassette subfamily B protein
VKYAQYWRLWRDLLALSWRRIPRLTAGVLVLEALSVALATGLALLLRAVVAAAERGSGSTAVVTALGAALVCTLILAVNRLHGLVAVFLAVGKIGPTDVDRGIVEGIASIAGIEHMERSDYLDRVDVLRGAAWSLVQGMWTAVRTAFTLVQIALSLWILGSVDAQLLILPLFAALPLLAERRARGIRNAADLGTGEQFRLQRHLFEVATDAGMSKELRVAGAADELSRRQRTAWDEAMMGRYRARLRAAGWMVVGWTGFVAGFTAALALVVSRAADGGSSAADVVLLVSLSVTIVQSVQSGVAQATGMLSAGNQIESFLWLRDYVEEQKASETGSAPAPDRLSAGIELRDVRYTYPGTSHPALDGISATIPAGSVVAVVGEYGSGKTTLVKLLSKFYQPDSGSILVDGTDLADLDTAGWRLRTSAAFQDFGRYPHLSFADAVGLGDLARRDDPGRLAAAVREAGAEEFAKKLPEGLDTVLGRTFGGVDLSEGQWQKVALARASMRTDPLLLTLDEPTASLDAPSEKDVFDRYTARSAHLAEALGAVTVIVSHRFSTVSGADLILVMDRGRLVEHGTHQELMARESKYSELFSIQQTAYRLPA